MGEHVVAAFLGDAFRSAGADPDVRDMEYEEPGGKQASWLSEATWSWDEDAMALLAQFYGEAIAEGFHASYTYAIQHTNHCIGKEDYGERTELVREGLHNYVRSLVAVAWKDDFDFNMMNWILPIVVSMKKIACFPERTSKCNYQWVTDQQGYSSFDMVQLALIAAETRRVCALLHATHALKLYLREG